MTSISCKEESKAVSLCDAEFSECKSVVCFVCTGNTCRSPMAAAAFNHYAKKLGRTDVYAISAGLAANPLRSISENAAKALEGAGIISSEENDYAHHISTQMNENIAAKADKIIGLTSSHTMALISGYPQFASKIFSMPKNIADPFGGDLSVYEACLAQICECVVSLLAEEEKDNKND